MTALRQRRKFRMGLLAHVPDNSAYWACFAMVPGIILICVWGHFLALAYVGSEGIFFAITRVFQLGPNFENYSIPESAHKSPYVVQIARTN